MERSDLLTPFPTNNNINNTNICNNNIKELFPSHSRKIDALEQRLTGGLLTTPTPTPTPTTTTNNTNTTTTTTTNNITTTIPSSPIKTTTNTTTTPSSPIKPTANTLPPTTITTKTTNTPTNTATINIPSSLITTNNHPVTTTMITTIEEVGSEYKQSSNHDIEEEELLDSDADEASAVKSVEAQKKKYRKYSQEEDKKILEGFQKFGNKWEEITKWGDFTRTAQQVRLRHTRLMKDSKTSSPDRDGGYNNIINHTNNNIGNYFVNANNNNPNNNNGNNNTPTTPSKYFRSSVDRLNSTKNEEPPAKRRKEDEADEEQELALKALQAERERLTALDAALALREEQLKAREEQLKRGEPKLENATEVIRNILITSAKFEKELARKKLAEDRLRLGQPISERHGVEHHEVWQDGESLREINLKEKALADQREQFEQHKKQLSKRKKADDVNNNAELEFKDVLKSRLDFVKRQEAELSQEKERLNNLKHLHMKELKRVADEDASNFNNFPVLKNRYLLLTLLGKGGFSEVYRTYDLNELRYVACKIHCVNPHWAQPKRDNYSKHALREFHIQKKLCHPKVVRLFDVFEIDSNSFCTVLEYCDGGDLDNYIKSQKMLSEREARCIISQIFSGLKYLNEQKQPVIHYDLKPANILFHNGEVKITDFGLSKIMDEGTDMLELSSQGAGTYWYLPPECFEMGKRPPQISPKVDVWSAGVILYQMLYGRKPFGNDLSQQRILLENIISNSRLDFPAKPVIDQAAKDFIARCLTFSQTQRPDVFACCNDNFIRVVTYKKPTAVIMASSSSSSLSSSSSSSSSTSSMLPPKSTARGKRKTTLTNDTDNNPGSE